MPEGSLEVRQYGQLKKQRWEESEKRREQKRREEKRRSKKQEARRPEKRRSQKKEDTGARRGRQVAKHCVFPMVCGSGGSKSRLAKVAGAEPSGQMRSEKLHAVVAPSTFRSKDGQNTPTPEHSGSCDVEKVHAVVARSTCGRKKCKILTVSDHFWNLR